MRKPTKPLFIPLKTEFFRAFQQGIKCTEFRPYGPRWNERTCRVGRKVVLSLGYGKAERLKGVVYAFTVDCWPSSWPDWIACYGKRRRKVACITIKLVGKL